MQPVSPARQNPGREESCSSRNAWHRWRLRQQQDRLQEQRRRLCEKLGEQVASGQVDASGQLELREQIGQLARELARFESELQEIPSDPLGQALNSYWSLGAVAVLVIGISLLISASGQADTPEAEPAPTYAALEELAGPALAESDALTAAKRDEFLSRRLTQLAAGIPVPAVAVSEDVLTVGGNWQLSPPEYNRSRYEWVFPLRFDAEQPLPRLHSGLLFKAVDADGAAIYEAPVRLAVSTEPGERVLAALVIQDRDAKQGILTKVRQFHLAWQPPAERPPSLPETQLALAIRDETPKVFKFPPRKKRTVYQPAPSLLAPPVATATGVPRIPQSGSTIVTVPTIPVYPYPQSGSTTIRRSPQSGSTTIRRGRVRTY